MGRHFIFGYGSLISSESRSRTAATGCFTPARVSGFKTEWNSGGQSNYAVASVMSHADHSCVGVVFQVEEEELRSFDDREKSYERLELDWQQIDLFDQLDVGRGTAWLYKHQATTPPSPDVPIVQSYVDVILSGCLEHGFDFALKFIEGLSWEHPWMDDRDKPLYVRSQPQVPQPDKIDELLRSSCGLSFQRRLKSKR